MKISIQADYEGFFPDIKKAGSDGVDLSLAHFDMQDVMLTDQYTEFIMKKYQALKGLGLAVCQTHLAYWPGHLKPIGDGTYEAFEERMLPLFRRGIELTGAMGCRACAIHLYFEKDREKSRQGNIALITKLLPVLEKNQVILSIENIFGPGYSDVHLSGAADLLFYIDYFKSPYLGVCIDTGHALIRGQQPVKMLKKLQKYVTALHLHTTIPTTDMHAIPYFVGYEERIDWNEFYRILEKSPYQGSFNMEVRAPSKVGHRANVAFYQLAHAVAEEITKPTK